MYKILGIILILVLVMFSFAGCFEKDISNSSGDINNVENNNEENNNQVVSPNNSGETINTPSGEIVTEPLNTTFDISAAFDSIADVAGLPESTKLSEAEIKEIYDFGEYNALEKEIRKVETDDNFAEIILIKVGENDQALTLFPIISQRMMKLREQYADNEKISAILNNGENFVSKQQGGILVSIISENAKAIEEKLQESF